MSSNTKSYQVIQEHKDSYPVSDEEKGKDDSEVMGEVSGHM